MPGALPIRKSASPPSKNLNSERKALPNRNKERSAVPANLRDGPRRMRKMLVANGAIGMNWVAFP